ncbi:MAG TPA: Rnase Y domain-containing protein, partial [Candidatus Paceibacterota bacterium]
MSLTIIFLLIGAAGLAGLVVGYVLRWALTLGKRGSIEIEVKQMLLDAKEEAKKITSHAETKAKESIEEGRGELKEKEEELKRTTERLVKKEEMLDKRQVDIDAEVEHVKQRIVEIKDIRDKADALLHTREEELQKIAGITPEQAKKELMETFEKQFEEDVMIRMQKLEVTGQEKIERRARELLTTAIHRMGNSVASDVLTSAITLPSDEIKGKIIGKEGRNIKAFERATGVDVIVDDTPGSIVLSCFDPVRRQIARLALENLIIDGRIQPVKIEETVAKAKEEINKIMKEKGEQAAYECGVYNLDPRIIQILGRLHFRTSYGQNVLQ